MRLPFFFALLFSFLVNTSLGQSHSDSVALAEVKAAFKIILQKPDSAYSIAEHALLSAQHSGNKALAATAYRTRGWASFHKGNHNQAFSDLLESAELFRQLHDTLEEMHVYCNLGIAYSNLTKFTISAKYLFMADSLSKKLNNMYAAAEVKRQMGILYREQGQYKEAISYFTESMALFKAAKDTLHFSEAVGSLCLGYMAMSLPDSSLSILRENASLLDALPAAYPKATVQERYGDAYFALSRYDKALESYNKAYEIFVANDNKGDMAFEAMNIGKTYSQLKNYPQAESYLLTSYRIGDSLHITNYSFDAAQQLADLYKVIRDWPKAYQWLERKTVLQDSLQLTDQKEEIARLQTQYEAEKKDKEIALLKKDQELNHALMQRQKAFQYGDVLVVLLLLLIGILVINRSKTVQKARRVIELEKMRNTIARDLHDDMGSALSSINIISKVALEDKEKIRMNEHLRKIHENSGYILENMSDIVWTINPVNDTLENLVFKMREFLENILEPLDIIYEFLQEGNFQDHKLDLQMRKDVYLIFKEAVNNAAKYSQGNRLAIRISAKGPQTELEVSDNGLGFNRNEVRCGNGLRNMEERARQINGVLMLASKPGQGTTVTLRVRSHD